VPANPDAAWSPRCRYPTPAVVIVCGGKDRSSDEEEPVVAMYEEPVVAMYERSMMDEVGAMPVGCVPAAHAAPGHRHATTTPTPTPIRHSCDHRSCDLRRPYDHHHHGLPWQMRAVKSLRR